MLLAFYMYLHKLKTLMVEFSTQENVTALSSEEVGMTETGDESFEKQLRAELQELTKDPSTSTIEYILNYSRSLKK